MVRLYSHAILVVAFAGGALACDRAAAPVICLDYAAPSLAVSAFDATTGASAVGALVTASDGGYFDSARVSPYGPSVGLAYERPGTYLVTVSKAGYGDVQMSGVRVSRGDCHVVTTRLSFDLQPIP
jgi:hypothetical protein